MKYSIDFLGADNGKAGGVANHNLRQDGYWEGNKKQLGFGIDPDKIDQNLVLVNKVVDIKTIIGGQKIQGGLQKKTQTHTLFSIQVGDMISQLSREEYIKVYTEQVEFLKEEFGPENIRQAVIHFDETTPHLQVVMTNIKRENISFSSISLK